ncbi:hypothetical protein, partial [Microvirga zambiensis]|uniref:hypothetical protein n=1 Tax=Microvirga zambiensis TaxID=1402137 RepID=UPI001AEFF3B2
PDPSGPAQGHRRLRFSSPLNNVKEQKSLVPKDKEPDLKRPGRPREPPDPLKSPAPAHQNRAADEEVLSEALP